MAVRNKLTVDFPFQGLTGNPGVQGPEGKLGPLVSNWSNSITSTVPNRCACYLFILAMAAMTTFLSAPWQQLLSIYELSN